MITSRRNGLLKSLKRSSRCKDGQALLEGPHLVGEAVDRGLPLDPVLATPEFLASDDGRALLPRLPRHPLEISSTLLDEVTDTDSPRGIVAGVALPRPGVDGLPQVEGGIYVYVAGLQDPGNLGALARVAEASGAAGLALGPGTVHPNHPRALRASAGSLLRLPVARHVEADALETHLQALTPRWAALATRGGHDLYAPWPPGTWVLLLGAEGPGLPDALERRADLRLTIPLEPPVESLNATAAAAVVLFELRRQRSPVKSLG